MEDGEKFHQQMEIYRRTVKDEVAINRPLFNTLGPVQIKHSQATGKNMDARNQMEKFRPEEIAKKAAHILSLHVAQSPQTQELVDVLSIVMRKGPIYEQLAVNQHGEIDEVYVNSIQEPSEFAKRMANINLPKIQTTGEFLEYLVSVKRNEKADINDLRRSSNTQWETVFVDINTLEEIFESNVQLRESQYIRLSNSFNQIFNSMSKF